MSQDDKNKKNGLIVIGGGITGLTSAVTWARFHDTEKEPVLIIEKEPKLGGFVTSYHRKGYQFDTSQMISNCNDMFDFLGIEIDLKRFKGYYTRIFLVNPDTEKVKVMEIPSGFEKFKKKLMKEYPENAKQVEKFLDHSRAMYTELFKLKTEPTFVELLKTVVSCPKIIKNSSKTFKEYFDQFGITNPDVIEIFDAFAAFSGLPGDRAAALMTVGAMNSLIDNAYRPTKGFTELANQFEKRYKELGGEVLLKTRVEKILVDNGEVKGVQVEGGKKFYSDYVITTIDPKVAMKELVGLDTISEVDPKFAEKAEQVRMSPSSINIALGLDDKLDLAGLGMDCGYNVVTTGGESFSKLFEEYEKGNMAFSEKQFHMGVICPSLTTGGKPNITIRVVPIGLGDWLELRENNRKEYDKKKEEISNLIIDLVEKYLIPDLKKHIIVKDVSTPATYAKYSGSPTGSIYGMAPFTDNFGRSRLKMRTPIKGLFQPLFSHGIFGCMLGALQVGDMILNREILDGNARLKPKE
ncbi:MAG: NAD(P)/FAD-dependent oxidoreductase [Candidatus Heimdallarchaeota archaeon]|nr:NAD(P)/FAD-dependent oxidoreductase [Candidatus Heimdallarchaeota archaeon]